MAMLSVVPAADAAHGELVPQISENPFTVEVPQINDVPQIKEVPLTFVPQISEVA